MLYGLWQDERAAAVQEGLTAQRLAIQKYVLIPALKAIMARHHGDESWLALRPPLVPLTPAEAKGLFAGLDATGFSLAKAA